MDHADHDRLFVWRKALKLRLGANGRKGLAVDRGAIGFKVDVFPYNRISASLAPSNFHLI